MQKVYYLLPIAVKDNETPAADAEDEAEKLNKAASVSNVGNEVEVATENPVEHEDKDEDEEEEGDEEDDDKWPAQEEERAVQVLFKTKTYKWDILDLDCGSYFSSKTSFIIHSLCSQIALIKSVALTIASTRTRQDVECPNYNLDLAEEEQEGNLHQVRLMLKFSP